MNLFPFFGKKKRLPVAEEQFYLSKATAPKPQANNEWVAEDYEEGQLSVDVYQTSDSLVIKSTIAGVKPEDIDIAINNDMLTIRGKREIEETVSEEDYLYQECYWGGFSRSIILPCEVQADQVEANLKNGVLTITLPKAKKAKGIQVQVKEE
ncbi:MAG: Hsp20/alpha crystallin family protein [Candidatus Komeilibacteria bacterium]|nr:Hsp20/alpha crystallin family protein [Candidatus Komeilibacteria bacterium]